MGIFGSAVSKGKGLLGWYKGGGGGLMATAGRSAALGAGVGAGMSLLRGGNIFSGAIGGAIMGGGMGAAGYGVAGMTGTKSFMTSRNKTTYAGWAGRGGVGFGYGKSTLGYRNGRLSAGIANGKVYHARLNTLAGAAGGFIGSSGGSKRSTSVRTNGWGQGTAGAGYYG